MEGIEAQVALSGTARALVAVLRVLLETHPDREALRERLRSRYQQEMSRFDADPSLGEEWPAFDDVFGLLNIHGQRPEKKNCLTSSTPAL